MSKYLTVSPSEGESLDAFADRMAKKVAEHFGTTSENPVPDEKADVGGDTATN